MSFIPELPGCDAVHRGHAPLAMRYEDVSQDGRLMTLAMPQALISLWHSSAQAMPILALRKRGVVPVLSQMWIRGTDAQVNIARPARCSGGAILGHTLGEDGTVNRILLDMHIEIFATPGTLFDSNQHAEDAPLVLAGEVYARHVFTSLFAPAGQRRVVSLQAEGVAEVPPTRVSPVDFSAMMPNESCSEMIGDRSLADVRPIFGLQHSDANHHVNSLVYPRMFEDAAQRRIVALEGGSNVLSRQVALQYRRPFFAGQESDVYLGLRRTAEVRIARGEFLGPAGKVHCQVAMRLEPLTR